MGRRGLLGAHAGLSVVGPPCTLPPRGSRRAWRVAAPQVMQPAIPSPEMIIVWINMLMTGKATAKEQELQVGDHCALSSSTSSVSQCTRSLLSSLHSIITAAPRMHMMMISGASCRARQAATGTSQRWPFCRGVPAPSTRWGRTRRRAGGKTKTGAFLRRQARRRAGYFYNFLRDCGVMVWDHSRGSELLQYHNYKRSKFTNLVMRFTSRY